MADRSPTRTPDAAGTAGPTRWRPLLRALHRDVGYFAVGLTLVYALSGLAVNHVADWDPNFRNYSTTHELGPLPQDSAAAARVVLQRLGIGETPRSTYRASAERLDLVLARHTLHVNPQTGHVTDEGQEPRPLLRVVNWLHLNRGKKAWTYAADAYAVALLGLALSGMFMLPGRRGLIGRGGIFVLVGLALPALYVSLSGGP